MLLQIDKLGKVAVTVEESYWSNDKDYNKLTIVEAPKGEYKTYISRKPVPAGTVLTNRKYWIPFSSLKEEIVLDFNTFVNLWTENLRETNERLDSRIDEEVSTLNTRIDTEVNTLNTRITSERRQVDATTTILSKRIDSNDADIRQLYDAVASVVAGGVALLQTFGNRTDFGISQKVLTERFDNIQDQIDKIHPGTLGIVMSVNPNIIYDNSESNVTITARKSDNTVCESIKIFKGTEIIAEEDNVSELETTVVVNETTRFDAQAIQLGLSYESNIKVTGVKPYYVGSGLKYTDIVSETYQQPIKANPSGTYNINVANNGDYIFFVVPSAMNINKATMSGFNFPLESPVNVIVDNNNYKYYRSSNTYDAGNITIVIS